MTSRSRRASLAMMSGLRHRLALFAVAALVLHASVITSVTLLSSVAISAADLECTCDHDAEHAQCPMHHSTSETARCRMQSTQNLGLALVAAMAHVAVLSQSLQESVPEYSPLTSGFGSPAPYDVSLPPDSPPPRI